MKSLSLKTLALSALLGLSVSPFINGTALALTGGQDSGGGCVYASEGKTSLLDFSAVDANYKANSQAGDKIRPSAVAKALGSDDLDVTKLKAHKQAVQIAKNWGRANETTSYISDLVVNSLKTMQFSQSIYSYMPSVAGCPVPANLKGKVHAAVYYDDKIGALLFLPTWNQLDQENQIGILIHESLRMIQVSMESGISNRAIQVITSSIVRGSPSLDEVLQLQNELGPLIQNQIKNHQEVVGYQKTLCAIINEAREKAPAFKNFRGVCVSPERMNVEWVEKTMEEVRTFSDTKNCDRACKDVVLPVYFRASDFTVIARSLRLSESDSMPEMYNAIRGMRGLENVDNILRGVAYDSIKEVAVAGESKSLSWSQNDLARQAVQQIQAHFEKLVHRGILQRAKL